MFQMDVDYIENGYDYNVEEEHFYEVNVPTKAQNKRRVTFKSQVSTNMVSAILLLSLKIELSLWIFECMKLKDKGR